MFYFARVALPTLFVVAFTAGCGVTVGPVNPRPNVVVTAGAPKVSQDLTAVHDNYELELVKLTKFKTTLDTAFKNAVGSHYTTTSGDGVRLVIENLEPHMSDLGNIGRFMIIRFRGKWVGANGAVLAEFTGVAHPRNPTEPGKRHVEDVVEVLYEKMIDALNQAAKAGVPAPAAAPVIAPGTSL